MTLRPSSLGKRDEGDVIGKVYIHEIGDFLLREAAFDHEEAALQRLRTSAADRRQHVILVVGPQRADFDVSSVAQAFGSGVIFQHSILFPARAGAIRAWPGLT